MHIKFNNRFLLLVALALFNLAASAGMGQSLDSAPRVQPSSPTVTAASSDEVVRFTAPGNITHVRLEVFSSVGEKVFDSGDRDGNLFHWRWQDEKALTFSAESYLCVVTVQSLSGKASRKLANVSFADKQATLKPIEVTQLNPVQAQALDATETDTPLTIIDGDQPIAATVTAHDGTDGQITRGRGALSFRFGDFFSGNDKEQMRLTEDGNLGIGTAKPKAKLDVAGTIRAREGFLFSDGSTLNVNDKGALTMTSASGTVVPNVTGSGTTGRLTKWTDGQGGILGDSVITESVSGFIGIGNPNPTAKFSVSASNNGELRFDQGIGGVTPVLSVISQPGSTTQGGASILGAGTGGSSFVFSDNLPFFLVKDTKANVINNNLGHGTVLFTLLPTGNVGIGTTSPANKLHIHGGGLTFSDPGGFANQNRFAWNNSPAFASTGSLTLDARDDADGFVRSLLAVQHTGNVGIGTNNPQALLNVIGSQPAPVSGNGTNAVPVLQVIGAKGGDTTTSGNNGGTGAGVLIQAGSGGNTVTGIGSGGDGGSITIQAGSGGGPGLSTRGGMITLRAGDGTTAVSGVGGSIILEPGKGKSLLSADGSVGIGTGVFSPANLPLFKLHVIDSGNTGLRVETNTVGGTVASFGQNGDFAIDSNGTSAGRFVVKETGNVGIGTTTPPSTKLEIRGNALIYPASGPGSMHIRNRTDSDFSQVVFDDDGNFYRGYIGYIGANAALGGRNNTVEFGTQGVFMTFRPNETEIMRLTDTKVGIGTVSPDHTLTVNGTADKPGGGSWDVFSDERLKNIKGRFTPGLKALMKLQPLRYEYKPDNALGLRSSGEHIGFGAQAVQQIIPEAVSKNDRGYLLVNNDPIMWTMLNAIKEQQQEITEQQEEIKKQKDALKQQRTQLGQQSAELLALKQFVCRSQPKARFCK